MPASEKALHSTSAQSAQRLSAIRCRSMAGLPSMRLSHCALLRRAARTDLEDVLSGIQSRSWPEALLGCGR